MHQALTTGFSTTRPDRIAGSRAGGAGLDNYVSLGLPTDGRHILHRAVAKLDLRLVPDMTAKDALSAVKAHLAKRGFGDIEVNMSGGYDPTTTPQKSALIQAQAAVYRRNGIEPVFWPRLAGLWPGYVFTGDPLRLPAGHFGLGHGNGAHAPDEYLIIESSNSKVQGFDGGVRSQVEYLYQLAAS
jgi:acetylornithine deacetylase/succinyl-diaminopimelate desuccinylase-like protein